MCVIGESDSGKSFVLVGLKLIYSSFSPPDAKKPGNFPLSGMESAEVLVWNDMDYEYQDAVCSWSFFKNLLDGPTLSGPLNLPQQGNIGLGVKMTSDAPWFGSAFRRLSLTGADGRTVPGENKQMDNRIRYISMNEPLPESERGVAPCKTCFARASFTVIMEARRTMLRHLRQSWRARGPLKFQCD